MNSTIAANELWKETRLDETRASLGDFLKAFTPIYDNLSKNQSNIFNIF